MNLRQLEALHHVMQTGSISEAARVMSRTQPTITALIKGLETSVQLPLFERRGRGLVPTPEAEYLYEESRVILDRLGRARETMDSLRSLKKGNLSIASTTAPSITLLPKLSSQLLDQTSDIDISLVTGASLHIHHLVASQKVDIGIADLGNLQEHIDTNLVHYEPFKMTSVIAVCESDQLAQNDVLKASDLSNRALVMQSNDHHVFKAASEVFLASNAVFNVRMETQTTLPQFSVISEGAVIGLVDPMSARSYLDLCGGKTNIVFIPFEPKITFEYVVMTPNFRVKSQLQKSFKKKLLALIPRYISI